VTRSRSVPALCLFFVIRTDFGRVTRVSSGHGSSLWSVAFVLCTASRQKEICGRGTRQKGLVMAKKVFAAVSPANGLSSSVFVCNVTSRWLLLLLPSERKKSRERQGAVEQKNRLDDREIEGGT
jgi:hypothetical protein